jgi:hypothetical protein|eukprot:COSAG01_NODE_4697_length_4806_cov_2.403654_6_plen_42_part_00
MSAFKYISAELDPYVAQVWRAELLRPLLCVVLGRKMPARAG